MQSCACKLKHACERSLAETSRDIPHDVSVASERVGAAPGRAVAAVAEAEGGGGGGGGVGGLEGGEDGAAYVCETSNYGSRGAFGTETTTLYVR